MMDGDGEMTTIVKVDAHCSNAKEVVVQIAEGTTEEITVIQDGESIEKYAYDARRITIYERDK